MKRTFIWLAGAAALGVVGYVGGQLVAQTGTPAPAARAAAPTGKVALLNLTQIMKKYEKSVRFSEDMKKQLAPIQEKYKKKMELVEAAKKEGETPTCTQQRKDELQKLMLNYKRELEDIQAEGQNLVLKQQDAHIVQMYKEIADAASRYAQQHGFEVVLHYNDQITSEEYWSPMNISRKMGAGACMPIYYSAGVDISNEIVTALNASFKGGAVAAPTPGH